MHALKRRWSGLVSVEGAASELEGPEAPGSEPPSPPQRSTGGKRKLGEDYATDADEELPAPKKRFPGLSSIASSLLVRSRPCLAFKLDPFNNRSNLTPSFPSPPPRRASHF